MTIEARSSPSPRLDPSDIEGASSEKDGGQSSQDLTSPRNHVNGLRKTISRWLRLQKQPQNHPGQRSQRYKLTGWPPRWVRRGQSPDDEGQDSRPAKHRALPPVPQGSSSDDPEDHVQVHVHNRVTPEMRPEDFPPGVAYLPDGDDDDEDAEFAAKNDASNGQIDFASTIETVKNCDWYWGPICGDAAEQVLQYEPDGSFLVRDSSDDRHIFSLTFKLNGTVRHVRIEHDQGNFSFGSFTRFKSNTIVDFVENAVEHSRSGRYLFFLNRRLPNGPMRVQLLHPVSRVKKVQSLQHMCRFVILKLVPRDHVEQLPVPNRIKDYLKTPNYYSENIEEDGEIQEVASLALKENPEASQIEAVTEENVYLATNDEEQQT